MDYFNGIAHVLAGDPTATDANGNPDGSAMVDLGETFQVDVSPQLGFKSTGTPSGAQAADGAYNRATPLQVTIEYHKDEAELLAAMFNQFTVSANGGLLIADQTEKAVLDTLVVVPVDVVTSALSSQDVWWVPRFQATDNPTFSYTDNDGEDSQENYSITVMSRRADTDQGGNAIAEGARLGFRDTPSNQSLPWGLPAPYDGS